MKTHQLVAIILGLIVTGVSFLPVIFTVLTYNYRALVHPSLVKVFLYPTIGVSVASIIVFASFLKSD